MLHSKKRQMSEAEYEKWWEKYHSDYKKQQDNGIKRYRKRHPKKVRDKQMEWRRTPAGIDSRKRSDKKWRETHRDEYNAYQREYRRRKREQQ